MWIRIVFGFILSMSLAPLCMSLQTREYTTEAGIDTDGNIYVGSDAGKPIKMATVQHCIEARFARDNQTVGCSVARGTKAEEAMQSIRLEVYLRNGKVEVIETKTPMDWHFWQDGQQVVVYSRSLDGKDRYALYDTATARLIEALSGPLEESLLPEWAKSPAEIQDESVPVGNDYTQERTKWIAKVLRQIKKIEPGMTRQDLLKVFTTEGGLSTRFQRTYVYSECPYIKVNVRFKAKSNDGNGVEEEPDDIIESISPPYLAWSVMN